MNSTNNKLLSVIIPVFNRQDYVLEAVNSVLNQKLPSNWKMEVIIVDDGSTDNSVKNLDPIKNKITIIQIDHSGLPSVARNTGVKASSGQYIAFQDSDDIWNEDKLLHQLPLLEDEKIGLIHGNAQVIDQNGKKSEVFVTNQKDEILDPETVLTRLVNSNEISTLTVVIKRQAIVDANYFDESNQLKAIEDYNLWLKIAVAGYKFASTSYTCSYYRKHDENISNFDIADKDIELLQLSRNLLALRYICKNKALCQNNKLVNIIETRCDELSELIYHKNFPGELNKKPLVSVIMPVYNGSRYVKDALDSVLSQTFQNFEIVIINDGSNDDTAELLEQYNDKRIRLYHQSNHGIVDSLNKLLQLSRADIVARQDADDLSLPSRLEEQFRWLIEDSMRIIVGAYFTLIDPNNTVGETMVTCYKHKDILRTMYFVNPFGHGTVMFRKSAVLKHKGYRKGQYLHIEDFDLWRRIRSEGQLGIIPHPLYLYRSNPEGISSIFGFSHQEPTKLKIIEDLWQEPFVSKSIQEFVDDYHSYKQYDNHTSWHLHEIYIHKSIELARELIKRQFTKEAYKIYRAIKEIDPKFVKSFEPEMKSALKSRLLVKAKLRRPR